MSWKYMYPLHLTTSIQPWRSRKLSLTRAWRSTPLHPGYPSRRIRLLSRLTMRIHVSNRLERFSIEENGLPALLGIRVASLYSQTQLDPGSLH